MCTIAETQSITRFLGDIFENAERLVGHERFFTLILTLGIVKCSNYTCTTFGVFRLSGAASWLPLARDGRITLKIKNRT